jgi:hypothetical protein
MIDDSDHLILQFIIEEAPGKIVIQIEIIVADTAQTKQLCKSTAFSID